MSPKTGLVVEGLRVDAVGPGVDIVADIDLTVPPGTALGIVGESGCGKTTVAMGLLGWARPGTAIAGGSVRVGGRDILQLPPDELRAMRGRVVSFVPQNPSRALSPGMRVGRQLAEMVEAHLPERDQDGLVRTAWEAAQLPYGREYLARYPHQLSGGQQQRVAIAMSLVCEPTVIVLDEPTTGLDVITQARLLEVIGGLRRQGSGCVVYISHDLGVVRNLVDRIAVMYGGRIVEEGSVDEVFSRPHHPYTRRLLEAIPRIHRTVGHLRGIPGHAVEPWQRPPGCPFAPRCEYRVDRCDEDMPPRETVDRSSHQVRCWRAAELTATNPPLEAASVARPPTGGARQGEPLLSVTGLSAGYRQRGQGPGRKRQLELAVRDVSFEVQPGECLAVVGESGSGKTTLARCISGLHQPVSGEIRFAGAVLAGLARRRDPVLRRRVQIVFQDADSSLNPSMSVGTIVARPLKQFFRLGSPEERRKVGELLERVHLTPSMASRLPQELSGGEKQRVAIARALAAEPELLVCDEVTSALDVAVQASILELLGELRRYTGMAILFISHDLAVVRTISDSVLVMAEGEVRELAGREELFGQPKDGYTQRLLEAVPDLHDGDYPRWGQLPASGQEALAREGGR